MYKLGQRSENKRSKKLKRLIIFLIFVLIVGAVVFFLLHALKPKTTIHQAAAITKKVTYSQDNATKKFEKDSFSITLPSTWQEKALLTPQYTSFTWEHTSKSNSESITVYQDTIPVSYAVNRLVALQSEGDHLSIKGGVSENCNTYTKNITSTANQAGSYAKWQGVDFLCDQNNLERDVVGTSSADGTNAVILKNPSSGISHKFFFTYTDHSINGDYSAFTAALISFVVK